MARGRRHLLRSNESVMGADSPHAAKLSISAIDTAGCRKMERADVTLDDGRVAIFVLLELHAPARTFNMLRWLLRLWHRSMTSSHDNVGGGSVTSMLRR
jgi:hypothetical protein